MDENGIYTFKISDSDGDGIDQNKSDFDYSLRFDGDLVVKETNFHLARARAKNPRLLGT